MFKVQNHANTQVGDSQIIQYQPPFVISDPVNHLRIYDNRIEGDKIRHECANFLTFVETSNGGCCRNGIFRNPNSTTNAFSYGFSTIP